MVYRTNNLLKIFIIVFIVIFAVNIGIIVASKNAVNQKENAALEAGRPANVSLVIIKDSSCTDCADVSPVINAIKNTNIKITKEETFEASSAEAKKIISEQGIKKLPTFIMKGELNKNADVAKLLSQIGEIKNDSFKLTYFLAPYLDLATGSVKGKVALTFITDKSCAECFDVTQFTRILANDFGMVKPGVVSLDKSDKEAVNLIAQYKIQEVPMFILSGDLAEYQKFQGIWLDIGTLEKNGDYVLRNIKKVNPNLIYRDLATGKIIKPEVPKTPAASPPGK